MNPLFLAAALLVVGVSAQPAPPDAQKALETARTAARANFLAQAAGQPTIDTVVRLPAGPADQVGELKLMLDSARETQLGCVLPCSQPEDALVYRSKIELIGTKLGLDSKALQVAVDHYMPGGKPRLRAAGSAGPSNGDQMVQAKVMEQLLRDPHVDPATRQRLGQKALAYADALGHMNFEAGVGSGGVAAGGSGRRLTPQQLASLSQIPRAQADILRRLATKAPPPAELTAEQRQEASMRECEAEIKRNPGTVRQSRNFWTTESQDKNSNWLWRGYAYFNRGLLAVSGLTEVEESAARTGWASASADVSTRRAVWEGTKLAGNTVLFAANFVGFSGAGNVIKTAKAIDNPVVLTGLKELGTETVAHAAPAVAERAASVTELVGKALGQGRDYKAATSAMNHYAATELGGLVSVERGGKVGEAVFELGKDGRGVIKYNPLVGESHEFTHAAQMLVNRSSALELVASKAGKPIAQLSEGEVGQAMKLADEFEKAYYAQHEAQAFRSTGLLGMFPGKNFGTSLAKNSTELAAAWAGKPGFSFSTGQKVFGALSGMGHSQAEIGMTLLAHANIPQIRAGYSQAVDGAADLVGGLLPQPTLPSQQRAQPRNP